jgi:transposase
MTQVANTMLAFIGCDVGKIWIAVHDSRTGRTWSVRNNPKELAALARQFDNTCLVVCEATGGYELALLAAMVEAGIPAHRADARKVKAFIRSDGILAKTDRIDAIALARYGADRHARLSRWKAPDAERATLHVLVHARQDLVRNRTAHKNRLAAPGAQAAAPFLGKIVKALDGEIKAIEQAIKAEIRANKKLHKAVKLLRSVCGIGLITAAGLLALMPELGTLNRRQIASLGGLAPHPRQSGNSDKYRFVWGGRQDVKSVLFMAALSASRFHKTLRVFYQRLLARGKLKLVALTAVMRKLLIICNALLREPAVPDAPAEPGTQTALANTGQTDASTAYRPLSPPAAGVKPRSREAGRQRRRA